MSNFQQISFSASFWINDLRKQIQNIVDPVSYGSIHTAKSAEYNGIQYETGTVVITGCDFDYDFGFIEDITNLNVCS